MAAMEGDSEEYGNGVDSKLDLEVIRCLDSVHQLVSLRDALSQVLRQGWMEMASARYAMGPSRVSQPLFSLKPYAASAFVSVTAHASSEADDDEDTITGSDGPLHMSLQRQRLDTGATNNASSTESRKLREQEASRQVLDQLKAVPTDWTQEEDAAYKRMMRGVGDSDSESESLVSTQSKGNTKPLQWFGALVSPHLRATQGSFQSALEIVVDIANAQGKAVFAHNQVMRERGNITDGPQTPEATDM